MFIVFCSNDAFVVTVHGFRGSEVQGSEVALVPMLRCGNVHPALKRRHMSDR